MIKPDGTLDGTAGPNTLDAHGHLPATAADQWSRNDNYNGPSLVSVTQSGDQKTLFLQFSSFVQDADAAAGHPAVNTTDALAQNKATLAAPTNPSDFSFLKSDDKTIDVADTAVYALASAPARRVRAARDPPVRVSRVK